MLTTFSFYYSAIERTVPVTVTGYFLNADGAGPFITLPEVE
jgi:hypothetical protein